MPNKRTMPPVDSFTVQFPWNVRKIMHPFHMNEYNTCSLFSTGTIINVCSTSNQNTCVVSFKKIL